MIPPFAPPEVFASKFDYKSYLPEDLYALGMSLYLLAGENLTGSKSELAPIKFRRANLTGEYKSVFADLHAADPIWRPSAQAVSERLKSIMNVINSVE
jgi:hypothetical protein